jgi:predicted Zn-dependent protease
MGIFTRSDDNSGTGSRISGRLIIAVVIALVSIVGYYGRSVLNPITGQKQHISMTVDQEIALGVHAAPEMAAQFGGLANDPQAQGLVDSVGSRIVAAIPKAGSVYPFHFHVLADPKTVNAFALPGGQVFITEGLLKRLESEGQLAGVLGHEVGHVVGRHSAELVAKAELTQGLTGAAVIATYDPDHPSSANTAAMAALVGQLINLKFSREHELAADRMGVRFMADAGYDPESMIGVMQVLENASRDSGRQPEFFQTHPNPEHRIERIKEAIQQEFPNGVPPGLKT